jgi:alpha-1,6-mannosyltransferase
VVPLAGGAGALSHPAYSETYLATDGPDGVARAVQRLLARPHDELRRAALLAAATFPSSEQHFEDLFDLYARLLEAKRQLACGVQATAIPHSVPMNHARG